MNFSVDTMRVIRIWRSRNSGSFPSTGKILLFFEVSIYVLWPYQLPIQWVSRLFL